MLWGFKSYVIFNKSFDIILRIAKRTAATSKMSNPKRYFINNLGDYRGGEVKIDTQEVKAKCFNYAKYIFEKQRTSSKDCDGGLYVGVAGVSYMCYYLSQHPDFEDERSELLARGESYLNYALAYVERENVKRDKTMAASFLLGRSGIYALAAVLMDTVGKKNECDRFLDLYTSLADVCLPVNFLSCGSDELFVGRAGYLCGALFLKKRLGIDVVPMEKVCMLCQAMINSGREYSKRVKSPSPLMYAYYDTEYLGAAHGLSAILQILLSFPHFLDTNSEAEGLIKGAVDFLLSLQTASGNFPTAMDEVTYQRPEEEELVHWCHGAAGVVYLMAKAYLRWKDRRYLQSCLSCGEVVWRKGLLKKGPGICHGVAGSGYVFLLLYRLTHDQLHLHRALQFCHFLSSEEFKRARVPDCPYSLYEGLAGTVCYLSDLLKPETAHFPFFDIL